MGFYMVAMVMMVAFMGVTWLTTSYLHLSGTVEILVRMVVMGLAFAAFGSVMYFRQKREQRKAEQAAGGAQPGASSAEREVEVFVRDAQTRLAQSSFGQSAGGDAKLNQLPVFFVVGETGSAKTSAFVNSGIEPDLLAGQVYQDSAITSTRPVNIWLAQKTSFVEAGGALLGDPSRWAILIKKLNPARRWWQIFGRKPQAPRAVIVCVDSEAFVKPNADEALAITSRNLHTRIGEISQLLGIRLPVYVVFTKLDRLAFFIDFVSNLSDEEATQVLGVTLPLRGDREQGGVYAEEESRILTAAFDELFHSLCDKRPPYLVRENDAHKLPAVYEFPREFRKLRNTVVRFLVDLGRPSQLRANPFLRGFYFSGVRPVVVKDSAPAARLASPQGGSPRGHRIVRTHRTE
jgi:type VI secretion system protein ImpL